MALNPRYLGEPAPETYNSYSAHDNTITITVTPITYNHFPLCTAVQSFSRFYMQIIVQNLFPCMCFFNTQTHESHIIRLITAVMSAAAIIASNSS